jgi:hypothetical protein
MSDEFGCDFSGAADAKAEIRLAVEYLLGESTGSARGDIVREIIEIVRDVANGPFEQPNPLDDGLPAVSIRDSPLHGSRKAAGERGICGPRRKESVGRRAAMR